MNNLDISILYWLHNLVGKSYVLDALINFLAQYLPYALIIAVLYAFYLSWQKHKNKALIGYILAFISSAFAMGILEVIRYFYHHPRPFVALHFTPLFPENSYSFPSGHATFFFALSTGVFFVNKRLGILFYVLTVLITLSRIAAGVHYPSDILGGAILGIFVASVMEMMWKKFSKK